MPDPSKILLCFASFLASAYAHLHGVVPQEYLDNPDKDISHLDEEMRMRITHARFETDVVGLRMNKSYIENPIPRFFERICLILS